MDNRSRIFPVVWLVAITMISTASIAQDASRPEDVSSCRNFAQSFYSWYVPLTKKRLNRHAFEVAIERKATVFAPVLLRALKGDAEAQQKVSDDIVGIDFDPFVGSQDPADHYDTREVTAKADSCQVEVRRNSGRATSAKSAKSDVLADLSRRAGRWQFDNFRYPDLNTDLLTVLETLRKQRAEQK